MSTENAEVTRRNLLSVQVCVPVHWQDDAVVAFAELEQPCGTENGWMIRRQGDEALKGDPERQPCFQREGYVHIMLDA